MKKIQLHLKHLRDVALSLHPDCVNQGHFDMKECTTQFSVWSPEVNHISGSNDLNSGSLNTATLKHIALHFYCP